MRSLYFVKNKLKKLDVILLFRESLYDISQQSVQFFVGIKEFSKTRLRRDIIYSFEDLLGKWTADSNCVGYKERWTSQVIESFKPNPSPSRAVSLHQITLTAPHSLTTPNHPNITAQSHYTKSP
jgi:hypothetical protein